MTRGPDPTACAEGSKIFMDTPMNGYADRCPDCGHLIINHPYPGSDGCELCRMVLALRVLETHAAIKGVATRAKENVPGTSSTFGPRRQTDDPE